MTTKTKQVIEALKDIRERCRQHEGMDRAAIANAHRMARRGYRGHGEGRDWTENVRRNFAWHTLATEESAVSLPAGTSLREMMGR